MTPTTVTHAPKSAQSPLWRVGYKLLLIVAIVAILLGVFMLYAQPEFLVSMADQLWSCF